MKAANLLLWYPEGAVSVYPQFFQNENCSCVGDWVDHPFVWEKMLRPDPFPVHLPALTMAHSR